MAKVDLSSSEWCDLIFSGKNKAYGAYQLREKSPKRHNIAVILVIVIALVGFSIPTLIKMATPKQKEVMTEVTTLSQLEEPEIKQEEMKRVEPVAPPPPALKSSIKFTAPVIKKDEEVRDEDEIKSQHELAETKVTISIADVKGNDEEHGKDIADLKQVVTQAEPEPEKVFDMVEQMPQFPGFSNLDRADHHGNHAVFQNRAGLSTAKADAAHPHGVPNGAPFFCNRREKAEHDRHGDCDLLRQVKPLHSGHEFADGCGRDYEVPHDNSRRKPEEQPHNGNRDKICNPGQIG